MKKRLNLILNGKGGVGKSFFAVNLVQYLKDRSVGHVACDCDNENSTLKRFHPEAEFLDLASPRSLDAMFQALEKVDVVVVDCRAASSELFFDYFSEIDLPTTLAALKATATIILPVNHELDSVDQLQRVVERLKDSCGYVVLRNAVHCDSFALYDHSVVRQKLRKDLGAQEITMNRLQPWLVEGLNRHSVPITKAVEAQQFHLLDRQRLLTWQRRLYDQIAASADLLGLPEGDPAS